MISKKEKNILVNTPWVQCPKIPEVDLLLTKIQIPNYQRGEGKARFRLDYLESKYRDWIKDIVNLDPHGIKNGWANWPMDFDPVWVTDCKFYVEK
jgi:hypothetical protein